ncbi:MAG TPA: N-6 DNA methylase [Ktedonobacteraceae bacterium]
MVTSYKQQQATFFTVRTEGTILPMDLLRRLADPQRARLDGLTSETYHLTTEKLNEAINRSWNRLLRAWRTFGSARRPGNDQDATVTREHWLFPLFGELGYGRLVAARPLVIAGKSYPISHCWQHTPIHLVACACELDRVSKSVPAAPRQSPHSLLQELLNRSKEHLWGMVSNGLTLRIVRNNVRLTRLAYVEFDLEAMMNGEQYADFVLFWLLCHQSRVEAESPEQCWLEKWSRQAYANSIRALAHLRNGVQRAIEELGSGFLVHRANGSLRARLQQGELSTQDYYRQVLRLVYRLLVLFVLEDRGLLFDPRASTRACANYTRHYSTARLRALSDRRLGSRHSDLFQGLSLVMQQLGKEHGYLELGLPSLNGFLFSEQALPDLAGCQIANHYVLAAVRWLAFVQADRIRRAVDYKNLGSEELGSVYESLLELHPEFHIDTGKFALVTASGNERKTSGTYYTPASLVHCLLDSALDPVLDRACAQPDPEAALLALKVCDPACGSGHFLIAAAHRIAKRLAAVRTGSEEPAAAQRRAALRDVVRHCIYGVDRNPMAVELCNVALWMEAVEPGKPLLYLDTHIQCGNSLLGAPPALLHKGIPNEAFEPIEGDDKSICSDFKRKNREVRAGQISWIREDRPGGIWEQQSTLTQTMLQLESMRSDTFRDVHGQEKLYLSMRASDLYQRAVRQANVWCAAFVWKKTAALRPPITDEEYRALSTGQSTLAPWREAEIERLAAQYQFFHWHLAFPEVFRLPVGEEIPENEQAGWSGGFDVVLGNTPWERIKIQEKEWFAAPRPEIAQAVNAARRRSLITALQSSSHPGDRELYAAFREDLRRAAGESHFVHNSQRYPLCGRGDVNTYALFAEHMRWIVAPDGRVGCIVPSGIATDETTSWFFRDLMETQTLVSLHSFENEALLFPDVHHATKFCLLTLTGLRQRQPAADFVFFVHQIAQLKEEERHCSLSAADIALLNPNTRTCPVLRSRRDLELTKAIYQRVPVLLHEGAPEGNPWNVSFKAMFHMANDSQLFCTREQLTQQGWQLSGNVFARGREHYLPLYEGKMIWQFDHRFGSYEGQTQAQANQGKLPELREEQHADPHAYALPHYWVHRDVYRDAMPEVPSGVLGFRDVTTVTVLRTAVFCLLPPVACNHKLPLLFLKQDALFLLYFQSNVSSFLFDYVARQKIGGSSLSFFILKQLPVLAPAVYLTPCPWDRALTLGQWIAPRALELTYTAWDLEAFAHDCGCDGPPFRWDEKRRFLLRCELDAAYFHGYGIAREDVDYIMRTFRVWKEREEKHYGEYRTLQVILAIYDEMHRARERGVAYRTRLAPGPADRAVAHMQAADRPAQDRPGADSQRQIS